MRPNGSAPVEELSVPFRALYHCYIYVSDYVHFQTNWLSIGYVEISIVYVTTLHQCPYGTLPVRVLIAISAGNFFAYPGP